MNILVTGAKGFVGRNLVAALCAVRDGKDRTRGVTVDEIFEADIDTDRDTLKAYCAKADFVYHLAGINRPQSDEEFMIGNRDAAADILEMLKEKDTPCPVMFASSLQATLKGRFGDSEYGRSKKAGEELVFAYGKETGAKVFVYRFPNLFGKWCRPNYNSVIATFCHNIANDLPIQVNNANTELELLYIDDLVNEMFDVLKNKENRCIYEDMRAINDQNGEFCFVPFSHRVTLWEVVQWLEAFKAQPTTLMMPAIPDGSFAKKLYATYLSYLPKEKVCFPLKMNVDERGSFTELLRTANCGQFSVNISKPGITKGQHWHHTKWEFFIVVSGRALIQQRRIGDDEILEFEVSGDVIEAVHMLPGYTHNIINLSDTDDLITVMWANEAFDPQHPDTFFEVVDRGGEA